MNDPDIRLLCLDDLRGAFQLSSDAGWNERLEDWQMLLRIAPNGSFAAVSDGRVVGTSIGIDYGGFAWIAMMLVDPACRGRGLGGRLLEAAMDAVPSDRPIRLDATPRGRALYQKYGFDDEAMLTRHVRDRPAPAAMPDSVRPLTEADLGVVAGLDSQVFGGNRRAVLEWALDGAPQYAHAVRSEAGFVQYCMGRPGRLRDQIGPVVASDEEVARALMTAALQKAGDRTVLVDAFDSHRGFTTWLHTCGFRGERALCRMRRPAARAAIPSVDRSRPAPVEFAILGPEFG